MSATLRYRGNKKSFIDFAKNFDAFKKVPEKYTETSEIGGTLSLLSRILIIYLIYKEIQYYQDAKLKYTFEPDVDMDDKVPMHVDITVAMPCTSLSGIDLMDETHQDVFAYGTLQREGTWWNMNTEQQIEFQRLQHMNSYLREEYHSIVHFVFKDIINSKDYFEKPVQSQTPQPGEEYDACRLHGTLGIHKVAGVLHLVGGAQPFVGMFQNHFMIEFRRLPANFTHRINRLSFGQYAKRLVQPLEYDETIVPDEATRVQYFLKIVPTVIHKSFTTINTYQYSVTENIRRLDPERNSYGSPGIYFKYDWSALKIIIRSDRDHIIQFLIRLSSIISGIVVISGLINSLLIKLQRCALRIFAPQAYMKLIESKTNLTKDVKQIETNNTHVLSNSTNPKPIENDLINAANQLLTNIPIAVNATTVLPAQNADYERRKNPLWSDNLIIAKD